MLFISWFEALPARCPHARLPPRLPQRTPCWLHAFIARAWHLTIPAACVQVVLACIAGSHALKQAAHGVPGRPSQAHRTVQWLTAHLYRTPDRGCPDGCLLQSTSSKTLSRATAVRWSAQRLASSAPSLPASSSSSGARQLRMRTCATLELRLDGAWEGGGCSLLHRS